MMQPSQVGTVAFNFFLLVEETDLEGRESARVTVWAAWSCLAPEDKAPLGTSET